MHNVEIGLQEDDSPKTQCSQCLRGYEPGYLKVAISHFSLSPLSISLRWLLISC